MPTRKVIDVLNEIEDNKPFFMSVKFMDSSGKKFGHSLPAMKYVQPYTAGMKNIRFGFLFHASDNIVYDDLSILKESLIGVIGSVFNKDITLISGISIMEPL